MNILKIILFALGFALIHTTNAQQMSSYTMQEKSADYDKVMQESLVTLRGLVSVDNAQAMGFRSDKEVEQAKAGTPLPIVLIQLDELRTFERGNSIHSLFKNYQQQLVPLSVNDEVRSSITLERKNQQLTAISYGSPTLVRMLNKTRQETAKRQNIALEKFYVVHVAALRHYFVAYDDSAGKVMFVPVMDDAELGLRAERALSAEDALVLLKTLAQHYNGLPL